MADSLYGFTDSLTDATIYVAEMPILDYDKDFAAKKDSDTVVLTNVTTPVDQPETLRYAQYDVANVYKNTDIVPANRQNGLKGKKNMISLMDTARVANGDGTVTDYPVKVSIAIEFPVSANISPANIWQIVKRCFSATQDYMRLPIASISASTGNGSGDQSLLNSLLRGGLNPQDGVHAVNRKTTS